MKYDANTCYSIVEQVNKWNVTYHQSYDAQLKSLFLLLDLNIKDQAQVVLSIKYKFKIR